MEMTRGMSMMVQTMIKMVGLDPVAIEGHIVDIGKSLQSAAADLATIRRQNALIMAHLNIKDEDNGESATERHAGDGQGRLLGPDGAARNGGST